MRRRQMPHPLSHPGGPITGFFFFFYHGCPRGCVEVPRSASLVMECGSQVLCPIFNQVVFFIEIQVFLVYSRYKSLDTSRL